MKYKFVEATQSDHFNYGKFMVSSFDEDDFAYQSKIVENHSLLIVCGWEINRFLMVTDLQTGEGAIFLVRKGASVKMDLENHKIWVCPMYEPFLQWLYDYYDGNIDNIPSYLEIEAEAFIYGYRRPGTHK